MRAFTFDRSRRRLLAASALAATTALPAVPAQASTFPEHPVTIMVPGPAGGSGDIIARLIAKELSMLWEQNVLVVNKPGAGGIMGAQAVLLAPRDGYTLLLGNTGPNAINYSLYRKLPYTADDWLPIDDVLAFPNVLIVNADSPIHSVAELVAAAKKNPKGLTFASSGVGQTTHLSGELFKLRTGANFVHVPYRGANLGEQAVMAGDVDFMFDNFPTIEPQIKGGRVRALAVTSARRIPQAPNLPTMAEAGFPNMEITGWFGLFAPAGVPKDRIDIISSAMAQVLARPEVIQRLHQLGGTSGVSTRADFEKFVIRERETWAKAVEASGAHED